MGVALCLTTRPHPMTPHRPLPDSQKREKKVRQDRLAQWAVLAVVALLVLLALGLLLVGADPQPP